MTYPPPPPPPPGYGFAATSGKATAVMVLGIVGLCLFCAYGLGVIPAIVALALAPGAKREIDASGGRLVGKSQIQAGVICSWVAVGLAVLSVVALVVLFAIAATTSEPQY
jgi:hypothetical protein